jgi:protein arginine kinase activator
MLCALCKKNNAVIHYAEVVDGKIKKLDLCEKCAVEKGLGTQLSFSMGDMLGGMTENFVAQKGALSCETCGMTVEEFRKVGRLGCSECYETFRESLDSMFEQIHRSTKHKGKIPTHLHTEHYKKENILQMEKELKEAIKNEDFEKAAYLRDEIKKTKKALQS